jgi:hypothetical protein
MGYDDMSFAINNCTIKAAFPFARQDKAVMTYTYTFAGKNVVVADPDPTAPVKPTEYDGLYLVNGSDLGAKLVWTVLPPAKQPSGAVDYRADVTDKENREGIAITMKDVYAKNSLVVKVYHNDTLMFTSTRRGIDDEGKIMFPVDGRTTANIVLWGKASGSWDNNILVKPNELNVPNKIEVWADGVLVDTYTNATGTVLGVNLDKYLALDAVQQPVAKVGTKTYKTLQAAIDACPAGGKVTLLRDAKGPGVVINKNITINFNGKTYYVNEGVGSTGTESNGFQILAGNKVTLSGGTLKIAEEAADKFYILIQNYADLTCFNMTMDGTYLDKWSKTDGDSYVLSNNSGNVKVNGTSKFITNDDGDKAFAFDVCDKTAWGYKLPVVTVTTTVKIDGMPVSQQLDKVEAAARVSATVYCATVEQATKLSGGKAVYILKKGD